MELSRQEYWSGLPFPSPGDLPNSGTDLGSPHIAGRFWATREAQSILCNNLNGKRIRKRIDTCICRTESLCYTPEINRALLVQLCAVLRSVALVVSDSLWPHGLKPSRLLCPWDSAGQNPGVGSRSLPTQRSNLDLLRCRQILYLLRHQGSPWILEWVAMPSSRGSSRPRDRTHVSSGSCTAGRFCNYTPI